MNSPPFRRWERRLGEAALLGLSEFRTALDELEPQWCPIPSRVAMKMAGCRWSPGCPAPARRPGNGKSRDKVSLADRTIPRASRRGVFLMRLRVSGYASRTRLAWHRRPDRRRNAKRRVYGRGGRSLYDFLSSRLSPCRFGRERNSEGLPVLVSKLLFMRRVEVQRTHTFFALVMAT